MNKPESSQSKGDLTLLSHVFLSYVRENSATIDRLRKYLINRQIKTWVDRYDVDPGSRWKLATRRAIKEANFFIACFSAQYYRQDDTWMNEELQVAIEKLRQRHVDRTWFIPVKLSPCELPEFEIGGGATLQDLQYVELYPDWNAGVERLATALARQFGSLPSSPQSSSSNSSGKNMNVEMDKLIVQDETTISQGSGDSSGNFTLRVREAEIKKLNIKQE